MFRRNTGTALVVEENLYYLDDYNWLNGNRVTFNSSEDYDLVATNQEGKEISHKRPCNSETGEIT